MDHDFSSVEHVKKAFRQVRSLILDGEVSHTNKHDGSPVTATDIAAEKKIQQLLQPTGIPVFGEESGYTDTSLPNICWLIDPIDGTKNFIDHSPTFTCMGVLIKNREAIAAVIYNPSTNDMYTAKKGLGAFKNNQRLNLAVKPLPNTALCKKQFITAINGMLKSNKVSCKPITTGAGFGFTQVAEGLIAARFQLWGGGYTHDYAPGALIVREAGGLILPILESEYSFTTRSFVACHPNLATALQAHIPQLCDLELKRP